MFKVFSALSQALQNPHCDPCLHVLYMAHHNYNNKIGRTRGATETLDHKHIIGRLYSLPCSSLVQNHNTEVRIIPWMSHT